MPNNNTTKPKPNQNKQKTKKQQVQKASTLSSFPPNQMARAVDLSPDGKTVAIGINDGTVGLYASDSFKQLAVIDLNNYGQRQITNQVGKGREGKEARKDARFVRCVGQAVWKREGEGKEIKKGSKQGQDRAGQGRGDALCFGWLFVCFACVFLS